jgi:hypothetical protein
MRHRYSLHDLCVAAGITIGEAPRVLAFGGAEYARWRDEGMTREVAERKALKVGLPPYSVWPEMVDHDLGLLPVCEADHCEERFVPAIVSGPKRQRFCSARCRKRMRMRRYRSKPGVPAQMAAYQRRYRTEVAELARRRAERRVA